MKVQWKIDEVAKSGFLGNSTKFKLWIKMELDGEEAGIVSKYSAFCPDVLDTFKVNDDLAEKLRKKIGYSTHLGDGFEFEFDNVHMANNFRIAALDALQEYKQQIESTRANVGELGKLHEIEIGQS
jgi:hypothetical protein